ncbi:MAG TPA: hypothetical protein VEI97_14790 [bacterium]|nr:hypothetical protein [bacterium]
MISATVPSSGRGPTPRAADTSHRAAHTSPRTAAALVHAARLALPR